MDATCTIQDSIHVFRLVHKYVSRILGTYHYLSMALNISYIRRTPGLIPYVSAEESGLILSGQCKLPIKDLVKVRCLERLKRILVLVG